MNLYLLFRNDNYGYDQYSEFVVAAPDELTARKMLHGYVGDWGSWPKDNKVGVEVIGTTDRYSEPTEILGNFHAG